MIWTTPKKKITRDAAYATNNELVLIGFRDNMKYELGEMVQKGHHYCT